MHRRRYLAAAAAAGGWLAGCATAPTTPTDGDTATPTPTEESTPTPTEGPTETTVERVADGLTHPWAIAVLDATTLLVTERPGDVALVDREDGTVDRLDGVPEVYARGQGGLLDVALHPEYPDEPWVYLTYAGADEDGRSATHLGRARLDRDAGRLAGLEELYVARPFVRSNGHFGSRVVVGPDDHLYVTTGDRQFKNFGPDHVAQQLGNDLGATLRLGLDGSVPSDNPFVDDSEASDAIYSYGHRNAQAMTVHPETGALWQGEHGERDGDEINVVEAGENYGWPIASEACNYGTDDPVAPGHDEVDGVVAPVHVWPCGTGGFPPSGAAFYAGDAVPRWRGDLFVGTLAGQYLGRFAVDGRSVTERDPLLPDRGWRVRAVEYAPDDESLYVAVDAADAPLVRLGPA